MMFVINWNSIPITKYTPLLITNWILTIITNVNLSNRMEVLGNSNWIKVIEHSKVNSLNAQYFLTVILLMTSFGYSFEVHQLYSFELHQPYSVKLNQPYSFEPKNDLRRADFLSYRKTVELSEVLYFG